MNAERKPMSVLDRIADWIAWRVIQHSQKRAMHVGAAFGSVVTFLLLAAAYLLGARP
jgi:hypothetical protein